MAVFGKIYTFLIRATGLVSKPTRQIQETEEIRSSVQQRQLSLLALSAHDVILFNMAAVAGGARRIRTDAHDVTHDVTHSAELLSRSKVTAVDSGTRQWWWWWWLLW